MVQIEEDIQDKVKEARARTTPNSKTRPGSLVTDIAGSQHTLPKRDSFGDTNKTLPPEYYQPCKQRSLNVIESAS